MCTHFTFTLMAHCTSGAIRGSVSCSRTLRQGIELATFWLLNNFFTSCTTAAPLAAAVHINNEEIICASHDRLSNNVLLHSILSCVEPGPFWVPFEFWLFKWNRICVLCLFCVRSTILDDHMKRLTTLIKLFWSKDTMKYFYRKMCRFWPVIDSMDRYQWS